MIIVTVLCALASASFFAASGYFVGRRREHHDLMRRLEETPSDELTLAPAPAPKTARDEAVDVSAAIREALGPMLEGERLGRALAKLDAGASLRELPRVLEAIAETGRFAAVVLSDDVGLPLASSSGAHDVDVLSGMSSFVVSLADRAAQAGAARPLAVVLHDAEHQTTLHRIFQVQQTRFVLSVVSRGAPLGVVSLDPALDKIGPAVARFAHA